MRGSVHSPRCENWILECPHAPTPSDQADREHSYNLEKSCPHPISAVPVTAEQSWGLDPNGLQECRLQAGTRALGGLP